MSKIAIIGAGCSGTLVARSLAARPLRGVLSEVIVFDACADFGPGLPYGVRSTDGEFILNMKSAQLGLRSDGPGDFHDWLHRGDQPVDSEDKEYVPRTRMGDYLRHSIAETAMEFERQGVRFTRVGKEATDLWRIGGDLVISTGSSSWRVQAAVLATGHLRRQSPFGDHPGYIANPYHDLDRIRRIPAQASVGVLGTKLTAVDVALLLGSMNVRTIAMLSNSGQLPLVRGVIPDGLDISFAGAQPEQRSLHGFLRWFRSSRAFGPEYPGLFAIRDARARLEREIAAAGNTRDWQLWLDATKDFVDAFWNDLDAEEKRRFRRKYQGLWMSYRHPMPLVNAKKILAMIDSGQLSVHGGYRSTRLDPDGTSFDITARGETLTFDYVIDATGFSGKLTRLASPLLERLIDRGLLRQHEHGSAAICPVTHQLVDEPGLYAIGPLTQGVLFYVSAIERLALHAEKLAGHLLASLHDHVQTNELMVS